MKNRSSRYISKFTYLKGQCYEIFFLWFFMNQFPPPPPAPVYSIRTVSNFSKIRGDIRKSRCTTGHRCKRHRRQIFPPVSLVLLIPVANLPPVSMIPAANLPPVSTTPVANCHRYQQHQWQTVGTIIRLLTS